MSSNHLVFVYGTLLRGFGNWSYLLKGQCEFLGEHTIPKGQYNMYSCGGFPCLVKDDDGTEIKGEVSRVNPTVLSNLDRLEGYPGWYERHTIETPWGPAYVYAMGRAGSRPWVTSGSWREYTGNYIEAA